MRCCRWPVLRPRLAILDETDSGLDIDALRIVADGVNALRGPHFSALVITHYQRLLDPHRARPCACPVAGAGSSAPAARTSPTSWRRAATPASWIRRHERGPTSTEAAAARFVARARSDAAGAAFRSLGLPTQREEAWHYTHLRPLLDIPFADAPAAGDDAFLAMLPEIDAPRAVFVNGRNAEAAASRAVAAGDKLDALNAMLAESGATIRHRGRPGRRHVRAGQRRPRHRGPSDFLPPASPDLARRRGAPDAHRSRDGAGRYLHNPSFDVSLAEGATLTHLRLQQEADEAFHLSTLHATIAAGATYDSFALNAWRAAGADAGACPADRAQVPRST